VHAEYSSSLSLVALSFAEAALINWKFLRCDCLRQILRGRGNQAKVDVDRRIPAA